MFSVSTFLPIVYFSLIITLHIIDRVDWTLLLIFKTGFPQYPVFLNLLALKYSYKAKCSL